MKLLVSVRNAGEAVTAANAGVDIIDVKEPNAGALGFAGTDVVNEVLGAVGDRVPVSAAMGECTEWLPLPHVLSSNCQPNAPVADEVASKVANLQFMKLGLAELRPVTCANVSRTKADFPESEQDDDDHWIQSWQKVRHVLTAKGPQYSDIPAWVAVAYADHERAAAPPVWEVLEAAAETGCSTLLIDTFCKDGTGTLSWLTTDELRKIREEARNRDLRFALAGQLTAEHLPAVKMIAPDVLAVRGAVCDGEDRAASVSADRIRQLRSAMS